jgi:hypothetical protein
LRLPKIPTDEGGNQNFAAAEPPDRCGFLPLPATFRHGLGNTAIGLSALSSDDDVGRQKKIPAPTVQFGTNYTFYLMTGLLTQGHVLQ